MKLLSCDHVLRMDFHLVKNISVEPNTCINHLKGKHLLGNLKIKKLAGAKKTLLQVEIL